MTEHPQGWALWVAGARPKTLPAAVVPVFVGTAAVADEEFVIWRFVAAMIVALALQIATNYANDYSDGIRGTDANRVGPLRLVGSGLASPTAVKRAIVLSFAVAGLAGLLLALAVSPWLLLVGVASMAAGWFYTGGSNPYGYLGLGEVFVFVFFGVVATVGSAFVQIESIDGLASVLSIPVGLFATALLVVNNLRDRQGDATAGKRTLAVRIGDRATRLLYAAMVIGAFVIIAVTAIAADRAFLLLAVIAIGVAVPALGLVLRGAEGTSLIAALESTGRTQLVAGLLLSLGLLL
ncbi:MAG: 1,4-dihydroxy-2-naphthoate polyprenyltransferase [Acidimicrobiales bacterium]|nr:1,4-dihydroxy-2-naphthoate polyprenyltransferase [Acidimicrobiales bacterium]